MNMTRAGALAFAALPVLAQTAPTIQPAAPAANQIQVQNLQNFTLACGAPTATTYTVTATGTNSMVGFTYTVDQQNTRTSAFTGSGASAGWTAASPNTCWVVRKGAVC